MKFAIDAPPVHSLAIDSTSERFPVNRVFCVGRNYAAHAREMGKDPDREPPFFFMKPASAVVDASQPRHVRYPPQTRNYHHEVELVVAIALGGRDIRIEDADRHIFGYAVGLDMTRRDLQLAARDQGRPWEFGKSFSESAPIGAIHRSSSSGEMRDAEITLDVNGQRRQSSSISKLIWSVAECISYLSKYDSLEPGDILMTGTPEGVAAVLPGDTLRASITGLGAIEITIAG